jgi:hypothetical protein
MSFREEWMTFLAMIVLKKLQGKLTNRPTVVFQHGVKLWAKKL